MNNITQNKIINLINSKNCTFPLIEELNSEYSNVTFVYKSINKLNNIVLVLPVGSKSLSKNKMINIKDTNIWYKTYKVRNDIKFLYYFSTNDSLSIKTPRNLNKLSLDEFNEKFILFNDESKVSYLEMPYCKKDITKNLSNITSNLIPCEIFSKHLQKTIYMNIYLPPNFDVKRTYGLSVFTDGDEHLELLHADKILDNLIINNQIKPMIGLFIESNQERMKELMCDIDFENFLIKEAIPLLKKKYNISKNPKDNLITGFSLGGLTAVYIGLKHPKLFSNILSQSGSFFFKIPKIRKLIFKSTKKSNIYLNYGILEDKKRVIQGNLTIYAFFKKNKFNVFYENFYSGHDFLSWGEYLHRGLIKLLSI